MFDALLGGHLGMLKSILVVLEGHDLDNDVVDFGIRLAAEHQALLVGLGIIDESQVHPPEAVPLGASQAKEDWDAARLHDRLVEVESHLSAIAVRCAAANVAFKPLETMGRPADDILVEAQRFDLILMSRQAQQENAASDLVVGDTLKSLLHAAPRPIVSVADHVPSAKAAVIAYDGSLQAARTLFAFEALGMSRQQTLHIISIHDDLAEASKRGNRAVEYLATRGVQAKLCTRSTSDVAEQVLDYSREVEAGLLVLGAYGKSRIQEFFLGSVTTTILKTSPLPLFMFH